MHPPHKRRGFALIGSCVLVAGCVPSGPREPVASKVAEVRFPMAVSSDGRFATGIFGTGGNVAIQDLASGDVTDLTSKDYPELMMGSVFSPDGRRIAYSWHNEDDFDDVRVIGVDGSEPRIVYRDTEGRSVAVKAWSHDSEELLATLRRQDFRFQIASISVTEGSLRLLASGASWDERPERMAPSPDGRIIAFEVDRDIFLIEGENGKPSPIVEHPSEDVLLGWHPAGSGVLFVTDRSGTVDVWMQPLTGPPFPVKRDLGRLIPLGFSEDGSFYYSVTGGQSAVHVATVDEETGRIEEPPVRIASAVRLTGAEWSPDGERLSHVVPSGVLADTWAVAVRSFEGEETRAHSLPMWVLHQIRPSWSPDGRSVLVEGWDVMAYPRQVVQSLEVDTGEVKTLAASPSLWRAGMIEWSTWSHDGEGVYFVRTSGSPSNLQIVFENLTSDEERILRENTAPPFIYGLTASRDGEHLAFGVWDSAARRSALMLMGTGGHEARELASVPLPSAISPPAWTADSRSLVYQVGEEFWRVSIDGEAPFSLGTTAGLSVNPAGPSVHPDGKHIAFVAKTPPTSEVWVLHGLVSPR